MRSSTVQRRCLARSGNATSSGSGSPGWANAGVGGGGGAAGRPPGGGGGGGGGGDGGFSTAYCGGRPSGGGGGGVVVTAMDGTAIVVAGRGSPRRGAVDLHGCPRPSTSGPSAAK